MLRRIGPQLPHTLPTAHPGARAPFGSTISITGKMLISILLRIAFVLPFGITVPIDDLSVYNMFVHCVPAPILAPKEDCRALLSALYGYAQRYPTKNVTWGRTVIPLSPDDPSKVKLPYGFQLVFVSPDPEATPNKCEVHIDNDINRLDTVEEFDLSAMVIAGLHVTDVCMPKGWAGNAYPGPLRNVYVSTIYTPGNGASGRIIGDTIPTKAANTTLIYIDETGRRVRSPYSTVESIE